MFREIFRHARAARRAERRGPGAGLNEHVIDVAVIATDELDDFIASRASAGKTNRGHDRFGAGTDEADLFDRTNGLNDYLGQVGFKLRRYAEAGSFGHNLFDVPEDFGVCMAENHRSPGKAIVDILVAVHIVQVCSFCLVDKNRIRANGSKGAYRTIDAAGDDPG